MYPEPPIPPTLPPEPDLQSKGTRNVPPWKLLRTARPAWTHGPKPPSTNNAASSSDSRNKGDPPQHAPTGPTTDGRDNSTPKQHKEQTPQAAPPTQPSGQREALFHDGEYYMDVDQHENRIDYARPYKEHTEPKHPQINKTTKD
eukprot:4984281-Prorocentrum_lima.AAC.1